MRMLVPMRCATPAPWSAFRELEDQLDRLWNGVRSESGKSSWAPAVDVHETETGYELEADLPGMNKEDIDVSLVDGILKIKGARKNEKETKEKGYHRVERSYGEFERTFQLPDSVNAEAVKAEFNKGVLHITLPKREEAKPKQIQVQVN